MRAIARLVLILFIAVIAASISANVQRFGPDQGIYCDIGKVDGIDVYCPKARVVPLRQARDLRRRKTCGH
jgi:hypothetical protein